MAKRTRVVIRIEEDDNHLEIDRLSESHWPGRDANPVEFLLDAAGAEITQMLAGIREANPPY